jgi:hypothetical protein
MPENKYFHGGNMRVDRFQKKFKLVLILERVGNLAGEKGGIWRPKSISVGTEDVQLALHDSAHKWST